MRVSDSTLSEIQSRLDISEVIGEYVPLSKKGSRYWGRCPFHEEKTPSFCVTPEKGVFYCFGCHKGGGLFQFVMEIEKLSFPDAVELCARKAGVPFTREETEPGGVSRETFLELNRKLAGSFHWLLTESPAGRSALEYLAARGVKEGIISEFQLGFAPPDREWLRRFLLSKNYSEDFLVRTGLFSESSGGRSAIFANRLVFPIASPRGEIIAFGGRVLGDGMPKYLNSPETAVFKKGENLFGINRAIQAIRREGIAVIVEGYMDVLAMHQAGITNAVAPLGTALTEQQARLIKRNSPRAILVFDGDDAGEKATLRGVEILERQDISVGIVTLPKGEDPADIVQRGGRETMRRRVGEAVESLDYLIEKAMERFDRRTSRGKEGIRDFIFPFVAASGSRVRADDYLRRLAEAIGVEEAAVRADFSAWKRFPHKGQGVRERDGGAMSVSDDLFLLLAVAAHRELFHIVRNSSIGVNDLQDEKARELFIALEEAFRADEKTLDAVLFRVEDEWLKEAIVKRISSGEFDLNQEKMVGDAVKRIKQRTLKRKRDELDAEIRRVERESPDVARANELLAEKMHLDSEIARLDASAG
jgi:DNA primase